MAGYIGNKSSVVSSGAERKFKFTITETTTTLSNIVYTPTLVHVFHNGVRLVDGTDYTATNGTSITLTNAAENGDEVVVISYASFQTSDTVSASAGGTFGGNVTVNADLAVSGNTDINGGLTVGTAVYPTSGSLSNRNKIINGAMQVAQRGTSAASVTGSGYFTTDRVAQALSSLGTWTVENAADAPAGFSRSHKITCTTADASPAAGDYYILSLRLEAQDLQDLRYGSSSAQQVTLSFWVKSNKTGAASVEMLQSDNSSKLWSNSYTISSADTWEQKIVVIPADTAGLINNDNGTGLEINFWINSGSTFSSGSHQTTWGSYADGNRNASNLGVGGSVSDYFAITGVQLEAGDTATPFEHRSYGQELALCQRYYETGRDGIFAATFSSYLQVQARFSTTKRATPTMVSTGTFISGAAAGTSFTSITENGFGLSNSNVCASAIWTASAEL